jgi:hypothetical protein
MSGDGLAEKVKRCDAQAAVLPHVRIKKRVHKGQDDGKQRPTPAKSTSTPIVVVSFSTSPKTGTKSGLVTGASDAPEAVRAAVTSSTAMVPPPPNASVSENPQNGPRLSSRDPTITVPSLLGDHPSSSKLPYAAKSMNAYSRSGAAFQNLACFISITAVEFSKSTVCPTAMALCIFDVRSMREVVSQPWKLQQKMTPKYVAYRSGIGIFNVMGMVTAHEEAFGYQFVDRNQSSMPLARVREMIMIADSMCGLPAATDNQRLFARFFSQMQLNLPISAAISKKFRGIRGEYMGRADHSDILGAATEMAIHMCQLYNSTE